MKTKVEEFIKNHTHINYCEAIIHPTGEVEYIKPNHVQTLIRAYGKPEEVVWKEMPITEAPIIWLAEKTNYIPVWTNGYIISNNQKPTEEQLNSLCSLIEAKLVANSRMGYFL